ncbi:hypothetical protein DDF67_02805 [Caulobacter endophyticus]|uniref:Uncharacterized protein n=2 Tax=Caulobacter endophyticus TaxID=2172652 RepID=A0A2T9KCE0_9CAUL|nr:hypothetical protein DDF67_02805 [Caulobacter endophyticus]
MDRVIYKLEIDDIVALDNDITMANFDLQNFVMGTTDHRVPASKDNPVMAALFRMAMKPEGPPHIYRPTQVKFPRS